MEFEFDEAKSLANKAKHGIDFVEIQALWLDEMRVEIPARTQDEPRLLVIGRISDKHWSAVISYRDSRVRLISVRRSRAEESRSMKAIDFDWKFDDGADVTGDLDLSQARRPGQEQRRVNVDFPTWMIESLDREAKRIGVTRQSIIKVWIADRLERKVS